MIETRNINGFYAALRGLIEALCAICWCQESLGRLPRLVSLEPVGVGKMLNAGYKRFSTMKAWYASVSQTVHPARGGHLLVWRTDDSWGTGLMTAFDSTYSISFFEDQIKGLSAFLPLFAVELRRLAEMPGAITVGRTMVGRSRHDSNDDGEHFDR
jgi:hypothetical protein